MNKICKVLLLLSVLATMGRAADIEIEVEQEDEPEDDEPVGGQRGHTASSSSQQQQSSKETGERALIWDESRLNEAGVVHVTDYLYDNEVVGSDKPVLLVFSKGLLNGDPNNSLEQVNEILFELVMDFSKTGAGHKVKMGYVDTHD